MFFFITRLYTLEYFSFFIGLGNLLNSSKNYWGREKISFIVIYQSSLGNRQFINLFFVSVVICIVVNLRSYKKL